jgi:uncharacterized protein YcbK (DUF882 family)
MACQPKPELTYDQKTNQKPIYTHSEIDQVFNSFPQLTYNQLDKAYIQSAGLNDPIYFQRSFYVIKGETIYKYLVGKFRVLDFMPKDEFYKQNLQKLKSGGVKQYLLLDKRVIHKFLELMEALEKKKLNREAFTVNDGFRHPVYNKKVGGAKGSLHTWGMAVDIEIGDVDKNGKINKADKKIVLDLLENQIIGNQGGVGRYPWSQTVHFDVRGWYARWDKQN